MANVLKMEKRVLLQELLALGWSYRRIQKETGIHRETVSKYDPHKKEISSEDQAKPAKVPTDPSAQNRPLDPKCPPTSASRDDPHHHVTTDQASNYPLSRSLAAAHDLFIREKLAQGLTAKRIYQDLVSEQGFADGYDSVKRYVRKLKRKQPQVFARLHAEPGEEAQVDFGKAAPTLKGGRWARPWLFKMVLSHSRHSYEEVVWKEDVETFIRCHEHAFDDFGGVPRLVRLDNLKSGVLVSHLYEPELNPAYAAFAHHAGFTPLPCLPRRPEHKGKVESGVGYTKDNALKGRRFESLQAQNAHLRQWNKTWARTRIHGTTKKQVWAVFVEAERPALQPLPEKPFGYFKVATRTVHCDGHIEVDRAYYSVPHRFVGQRLTVHYNALWVKAFFGSERVAFHQKCDPGHFRTEKTHLPRRKSLSTEEYTAKLLNRCLQIGPHCHWWAQKALRVRDQLALRAIQGVVRLRSTYTTERIDSACAGAIKMRAFRYHTVKLLCDDSEQTDQKIEPQLLKHHELIRDLREYTNYAETVSQRQSAQ